MSFPIHCSLIIRSRDVKNMTYWQRQKSNPGRSICSRTGDRFSCIVVHSVFFPELVLFSTEKPDNFNSNIKSIVGPSTRRTEAEYSPSIFILNETTQRNRQTDHIYRKSDDPLYTRMAKFCSLCCTGNVFHIENTDR